MLQVRLRSPVLGGTLHDRIWQAMLHSFELCLFEEPYTPLNFCKEK